MSFRTLVSGSSINPASGPFTPLDDPSPIKAAHTFFTSFPLSGLAGNSAFLLVPSCTCTFTNDSCRLGTSVLPTALAFATFSFCNAWKSVNIPFQSRGILIDNHHLQPALRRSNRRTEAGLGVRAEADRVAPEKRENGGRMSRGFRRQRPWWTPVSPATIVADCGEETST
ncbi:hypothetical protein DEO72_LG3g1255 [Vigna unguiculata]|uniref:Uncharacterized protein n=1 Tax=Vigna unguiculata TaxID=3917 RepID=A0A4D6LDP4_VIGUN|nr:hypothetical protein DEO72_LG3g1255 [Vigna unguiculata]